MLGRVFPALRVPLVSVVRVCWLDLMLGVLCAMRFRVRVESGITGLYTICYNCRDYYNFSLQFSVFASGWVRRWIYTVLYLYMYNVT